MASTSAFQAENVGSIPITCSRGAIPPNSFPLVDYRKRASSWRFFFLSRIRGVKNMHGVHPYIILHLDYIKSYPMDKYLFIW